VAIFAYLIRLLILFFLYFSTAWFGLRLDPVEGFATLFWPPTGIALAFVFLYGYKLWPGVFSAAFFINLLFGAPYLSALGISIGNTLEALLGSYILKRFIKFNPGISRIRDAVGLIFITAPLSTVVSAITGTVSLNLGGMIDQGSVWKTFGSWWLGDITSNLVVVPLFFLYLHQPFAKLSDLKLTQLILFIINFFISIYIFFGFSDFMTRASPLSYLVFPPLILTSIVAGQKTVVTSAFLAAIISVYSTVKGQGPFAGNDLFYSLLLVQSFMSILSITVILLSAAISENKKLELQKDEFVSIASHELKMPLTTLKALTQLLMKRYQQGKNRSKLLYIEKMEIQINNIIRLVNDLLDVSKLNYGLLELKKEKVSLNRLIDDARELALVKKRNPVTYLPLNNDKIIEVDKERINQVIYNLLINAMIYSAKGKKIIIRIINGEGYITVGIRDFGKGIAFEDRGRIFEKFYRSDDNSSEKGLGLGLYICAEIIKQHHGKIWVFSRGKGEGSEFFFSLPLSTHAH